MRRFLSLLLLSVLVLGGCAFTEPEEQVYEHFVNMDTEFTLHTEDVDAVFVKMFTAHPEQLVHLNTVSAKPTAFGYKVTLDYANEEVKADSVLCGTEQEVALKALAQTLKAGESWGVMVLKGCEEPTPEEYSKQLAQENYLVTMGLKGAQWQLVRNDFTKDILVTYSLEYQGEIDTILKYRHEVQSKITDLAAQLWKEETADEERVRAIHDCIIQMTKYYEGAGDVLIDNTPYGPLVKGRGVCDGYTYTAKLLLDAAGIENRVVTGTALGENHSWNMVKLGEKYYHMDVTWDDPVDRTGVDHLTYEYYLKSDTFMRGNHLWNSIEVPACEANYKN